MILETISLASIFPILDLFFNDSSKIKEYFVFKKIFETTNKEFIIIILSGAFLIIFLMKALFLTFFYIKKIFCLQYKKFTN